MNHVELALTVGGGLLLQAAGLIWYTSRRITKLEFKIALMWNEFKEEHSISDNGKEIV